jgi:hypothetical protein
MPMVADGFVAVPTEQAQPASPAAVLGPTEPPVAVTPPEPAAPVPVTPPVLLTVPPEAD